jgi:hypothetical protein
MGTAAGRVPPQREGLGRTKPLHPIGAASLAFARHHAFAGGPGTEDRINRVTDDLLYPR